MAFFLMGAVFSAAFVQGAAGFGVALVAMPLLIELVGYPVALPLGALIAQTTYVIMLIRYRRSLRLRNVKQLIIAAIAGIPVGMIGVNAINEAVISRLLGAIIVGYVLIVFMKVEMPNLPQKGWAYGFGFFSGLLAGALNVPGPPLVIFGNCRGWSKAEFKGNLQGVFIISTAAVIALHIAARNITRIVLSNYFLVLPGIAAGLWLGLRLEQSLKSKTFHNFVMLLLLIMGIRLFFVF